MLRADRVRKLTVLFLILLCASTAKAITNKQRAYLSFLNWRANYDSTAIDTKVVGDYPRLINNAYFIPASDLDTMYVYGADTVNIMDSVALAMSKWDIASVELGFDSTAELVQHKLRYGARIKSYNPDIKLFLYMCYGEHVPGQGLLGLDRVIATALRTNDWFIHDTDDSIFAMYNDGVATGADGGYPNYRNAACASWMTNMVDSLFDLGKTFNGGEDLFDGVWLDLLRGYWVLYDRIVTLGSNVDQNDNGTIDTVDYGGIDATIDSLEANYVILLDSLRGRWGENVIIYGNPGVPWSRWQGGQSWANDSILYTNFNGNEIQGDYDINGWVSWGVPGAIKNTLHANSNPFRIFEMDFQSTLHCCCMDSAQQQVRYTMTAALMTEAYYQYTVTGDLFEDCAPSGTQNFFQIRWWPEFNVNLGPAESSMLADTVAGDAYQYRRFRNGMAVVNTNSDSILVTLDRPYYDFVNSDTVETFYLQGEDGIVLREIACYPVMRP